MMKEPAAVQVWSLLITNMVTSLHTPHPDEKNHFYERLESAKNVESAMTRYLLIHSQVPRPIYHR